MMRFHSIFFIVLTVAALAVPMSFTQAQEVPADAVLRDFQITGAYILEVDGEVRKKAKVYQSQRAAAFLIRSSVFESPVLLSPREGSVQQVSIMSLSMQNGGGVDILADAILEPLGRFTLEGEKVTFTVGGKKAALAPNPPLTGYKSPAELFDHSPGYIGKSESYKPSAPTMAILEKQDKPVQVKVFFGSWCPFCSTHVPKMLKVQDLLEGSKVSVQYYGLPKPPFTEETEAQANGVSGVPTGIVYVDGKEVGCIQKAQWNVPEQALLQILRAQ